MFKIRIPSLRAFKWLYNCELGFWNSSPNLVLAQYDYCFLLLELLIFFLRIHYAFDSVSSVFQSTADDLQSLDIKGCWVPPKLEEHHELQAPKPIEFGTLNWWDSSWTFFIELLSWTSSLSRSDCFSFVQVDTVSLLQTDSSKPFFRCFEDFPPNVVRSFNMSLISRFCLFLMERISICTSL